METSFLFSRRLPVSRPPLPRHTAMFILDGVAHLPLGGKRGYGKCTQVDVNDLGRVAMSSWSLSTTGYPERRLHGKLERLHTVITGLYAPDHINGDKLDNRRSNLRAATWTEQAQNNPRRRRGAGVYRDKRQANRWFARISLNGKIIHLGNFRSPECARAARITAERKHYVSNS